jgi:hypothetical protein
MLGRLIEEASRGDLTFSASAEALRWRMVLSRRDSAIVAWHEVPGKAPLKEPSRRVRYDRARLIHEAFLVEMCAVFLKDQIISFRIRNFYHPDHRTGAHTCANHTVPYGTAPFGWCCPRHFVPGYDRAVPPGRKPTKSDPRGKKQNYPPYLINPSSSYGCEGADSGLGVEAGEGADITGGGELVGLEVIFDFAWSILEMRD